jgi:uncharacterized protein with HEPN domain
MAAQQIHQITTFLFDQMSFVGRTIAQEFLKRRVWLIGESLKACGDRLRIDAVVSC